MKLSSKHLSVLSTTAALLALSAVNPAQTVILNSPTYNKSYGNKDAGAVVRASAGLAAVKSSRIVTVGTGRIRAIYRDHSLYGSARANASADVRFLGSTRSAGYFRISLTANSTTRRTTTGRFLSRTCNSSGNVYLRVGSKVLWNWKLGRTFGAGSDYRLRISTPYLIVPLPGGLLALHGRAYGRIRGSMQASFDPCAGRVWMNGYAAASGDANASVTVISILFAASVNVSFYVRDQKLSVYNLRAQPGIGGSTWGRSGSIYLHSGAMRGYVKLKAYLPPFIPVSKTLANWSKGASSKRIL